MTVTSMHPFDPVDQPTDSDQPTGPDQPTGGPVPATSGLPPLEFVDPATLLLEPNIRTDVQLGKAFIASIRDHGVLVPVTAHRTAEGDLRVIFGQRRTLGAVQAGRPSIPVYVIDVPDAEQARQVARIVTQLTENDDRDGLREVERVDAHHQLSLLGLTATQIGRRTHRPVAEVRKSLAVAATPVAAAALAEHGLTLEQAAVLAEFADDGKAVRALTEVATSSPAQFDHTAQRLRDARAVTAARAGVAGQLAAAGIPVVETPAYGQRGDLIRVDRLRSPAPGNDGPVPLTPEEHAGCPGRAAYLSEHHPFRGPVEIHPVHVCTDWRRHGHQELKPDTLTGMGGGPMTAEQKAERREVVANNKAWAAAEKVRRRWLTEFLTRRTAPKDAPQWIAATLASSTHDIRRAMEDGHSTALTLLGLIDPVRGNLGWSPYSGTPHPAAAAAAAATPARATVITLGLLLGGLESTITRDAWRRPTAAHQSYLIAMQTWGYPLSEVEQLALTPAGRPAAADTGDGDGDHEADHGDAEGTGEDDARPTGSGAGDDRAHPVDDPDAAQQGQVGQTSAETPADDDGTEGPQVERVDTQDEQVA